ncbi:MAG: hypothetical protein PHR47_03430 [Candidatus Pacebacteria bacterium]|nr:hypothetical protein [Candidatus Paceibacterota bacterium]
MANFENSNEKDASLDGKRINLNWEEIRKGILASNQDERTTIDTPVGSIDELKEIKKITEQNTKLLKNDTLEEEAVERPSFSEIADFQRANEANEAKKELEEMFSTFSGPTEIPKEFLEKQEQEEESWNRPSGTEAGFNVNSPAFSEMSKESDSLEDEEELINRPVNTNIDISEKEKPQEDLEESVSFGINIPEVEITEAPPLPMPPKVEKAEEIKNKQPEKEPVLEKSQEELEKEKIEKQLRERLEEIKTEIEKKKLEISKIVPGLLSKFGLSEKVKTKENLSKELEKLEREKTDIENKLGITSDIKLSPEIEFSKENLSEKIYDFIKKESKETEKEVENLPPEKKTLFQKIKELSKDRKVQAAVIGSILLGVSIAVPPVGGAAWLTGGLVSGFLPASLGIPVKVLGGATAGMILRGSGGGVSVLRKIIENRKENKITENIQPEENEKIEKPEDISLEETKKEENKEDDLKEKEIKEQKERVVQANKLANEARVNKIKAEELAKSGEKDDLDKLDLAKKEFERTFAEFVREMYSLVEKTGQTPNKIIEEVFATKKSEIPEIKEEKKRIIEEVKNEKIELSLEKKLELIKNANSFPELYSSLKKIAEEGINPETIIGDVEHIRKIIKTSGETEKAKIYMADCFTGDVGEQPRDEKFAPKTDIPEKYGIINDKINFLLKKEIQEEKKQEKTENAVVEKTETFNTFDEFYNEIRKNEKEAESIIANIEQIRKNIAEKKDIFEYLVKVPKDMIPKLQELTKKEKDSASTENLKKETQEKARDFSNVETFDDLLLRNNLGLTEDEKADIKFIRIGHKEMKSLEKNLRNTVLRLLEKDTKIIEEAHDTTSFFDALKKICDSADSQNSFSYAKITDSMRHYINPDPKHNREEVLQEIPVIYGIRKKFLEVCGKEINRANTLDESSIPKKIIEENPEVLINGIKPKETGNKGPISARIQEAVKESEKRKSQEELEKILEETSDIDEFEKTVEELGEDGDKWACLIIAMIRQKEEDWDFSEFPEDHGIREAAERMVKEEKAQQKQS